MKVLQPGVNAESPRVSNGLLLSFLSGAAGLSYEILWTRQLTVETGGPLQSFTIVICSVIAGLALGAVYFGRHSGRGATSLRRLAAAQATLGGWGIVCALLAPAAPIRHFVSLLGPAPGDPGFLTAQSLAGAILAFPASILLGSTLPFLIAFEGTDESLGRRCGRLASANASGASVGALLSGFLLVPHLGLRGSLLLTAITSASTAGIALLIAHRHQVTTSDDRVARDETPARPPVTASTIGSLILVALAMTGFVTTVLEVIWTRVASLCLGSSVQAASLVLAGVIAGLALGNAFGARLAASPRAPTSMMAATLLAGSAGILVLDPVTGSLPLLAASGASLLFPEWTAGAAFVSMLAQGALTLLIAAPACVPLGALFPIACEHLARRRSAVSRLPHSHSMAAADAGLASAVLAAGSFAGAPAALLMLDRGAGSRACLLTGAVALAASSLLMPRAGRWHRPLTAALLLLCGVAGLGHGWDPAVMSSGPFVYSPLYAAAIGRATATSARLTDAIHSRGPVLETVEGAGGYVTVRRLSDGALSMQVNGKTDASTSGDMRMQRMTAHLPLLLHSAAPGGRETAAPRVLIVGLGSGVTLASALTHAVLSVEVIEISPEVARAASRFAQANRGALADKRARLTIGDARSRLIFAPAGQGDAWEIIASQPSNPWVSGQAALFTREFFAQARSRLSPGGLMCQWLQGHGLDADDFRSVVATFASVFNNALLWEESTAGGDYLLIGSDRPIAIDPRRLHAAMASPFVAVDLAEIELSAPAQILSHIATSGRALASFAAGFAIQTEDRLALEFTAPAALRRETLPGILHALEPHRIDASTLAAGDSILSTEISRLSSAARREREWARGLGLRVTRASDSPDLDLALTYFKAGMRAAALVRMRSIVERQPDERLPRLILAHLLSEAGDALQAEEEVEAAVTLDPDDSWGWILLARARHAAGHPEEALFASREAERLGELPASAWSDRCALHLSVGDLPAAEATCLEALSIASDLPEAHSNLGVARSRRGRHVEAERSFRRALELDPALSDARHSLAALLGRTRRESEALAVLGPLIIESSTDSGSLRLAARLSLQSGDPAAAAKWLERSILIDPDSEESARLAKDLRKVKDGAGSGIRRR